MIYLQKKNFNFGQEVKKIIADNHQIGAVVSFLGLVRDMATNPQLISMVIEHYPGMTEKKITEIEAYAIQNWKLSKSLIIHRYGILHPGEQIVLVVAAAEHRHTAFEACQFIIDWLKTDAPFWKLEITNKTKNWVKVQKQDLQKRDTWLSLSNAKTVKN
ncbi:MAG: molybdenum cofactor biosynthesis protein MoaE [Alphaproteobacteria bacterium]|nr:molybdenum cofactor biosynthesis protein MoaE [Alphaproteobacteria bacterium]